jgi:hypothetical protein
MNHETPARRRAWLTALPRGLVKLFAVSLIPLAFFGFILAFGRSRHIGMHEWQCKSNLRQLGFHAMLYADLSVRFVPVEDLDPDTGLPEGLVR